MTTRGRAVKRRWIAHRGRLEAAYMRRLKREGRTEELIAFCLLRTRRSMRVYRPAAFETVAGW